ncbi:hypothetical protein MHBO_002901 [Bonamia ostreae]|uniref:LAGLIDADG homing endonuclease n=1 Tax=Bonamia ostreae TaxID=126728 RepID=A0ABV2APV6_9EUKA
MDHLTMIFGNKDDRTGNKIWRELVPMNEKTFGVVVNGVAFWPRNLICFTASVRTKVSFTEGTSLLHLVHSKHPHITAMTAKNVAQVESIKLLKYLAKEESGEGRIFIPLKEKVLIQGNLRIARKSGFKRV